VQAFAGERSTAVQAVVSRLQERLFTTTQPNAHAKLAHLLLKLSETLGRESADGVLIDLTLSRTELAEMAGLVRETVSLVLRDFENKGWIKTHNRKIVICDPLNLENSLYFF
jgi:CRP/FNR family transcriptional regulator